jgi:hypothetical protein
MDEGRSMTTAAARSAALLHQLDANRQRAMTHAPHCPGGPLVTSWGYSVQITTCQTCGAVSTVRNALKTISRKVERHDPGN